MRMTRPLTMPITRAEVRVTNPAEMEMWSWTIISRAGVVCQPELSRIRGMSLSPKVPTKAFKKYV